MRKQEDVKEVVTGEEAEVASVVVEKDTTDRLVCVHCGRPWEGIKNVCECGGRVFMGLRIKRRNR
jgi:DNA-directed RNA polymerase subunit RPC12/RpoP